MDEGPYVSYRPYSAETLGAGVGVGSRFGHAVDTLINRVLHPSSYSSNPEFLCADGKRMITCNLTEHEALTIVIRPPPNLRVPPIIKIPWGGTKFSIGGPEFQFGFFVLFCFCVLALFEAAEISALFWSCVS